MIIRAAHADVGAEGTTCSPWRPTLGEDERRLLRGASGGNLATIVGSRAILMSLGTVSRGLLYRERFQCKSRGNPDAILHLTGLDTRRLISLGRGAAGPYRRIDAGDLRGIAACEGHADHPSEVEW